MKDECLQWLQGVKIEHFLNDYTDTTYKGKRVEGKYPPKIQLKNHVPEEFND